MNIDLTILRFAFPLSLIVAGMVLLMHPVHATIIAQAHSLILVLE